eukprot:TRINITY_DN69971_c0_g1_i1.p1 TRINITY_DN69971_c0_g1~~TRINITY_DN69971_c0_g1_i1.p1  ORF type:complete len:191 (+),score=43.76 TRINITY_DN69971_c0_g1_i1:74-574(+)
MAPVATFALHEAAARGDIGHMNEIMNEDEDAIDRQDANGWTPLHHVAANGEAAAGALLVELGAEVSLKDNDGNTPLHLTGIHGTRLVTSMLLWAGALAEDANNKGNTALHEAASSGKKDVAWLLIENGRVDTRPLKNNDQKTPLELAQDKGFDQVASVIESGNHED